MFLVFEY